MLVDATTSIKELFVKSGGKITSVMRQVLNERKAHYKHCETKLKEELSSICVPELSDYLVWVPFDELRNLAPLGTCNSNTCYKAENEHLGPVAVKEVRSGIASELLFLAHSTYHCSSTDVCPTMPVYGLSRNGNGRHLIIMKLGGITLEDMLNESMLPDFNAVWAYSHTIAIRLRQLHDLGIIHKDLHPGNIVVTAQHDDEDLLFIDLGHSVVEDASTDRRDVCGRKEYSPPELLDSLSSPFTTPAYDVYGLGMIMWQLLTTVRPRGVVDQKTCLPEELVPGVPPKFTGIYRDCWDESDKRPNMNEIIRRLEKCKPEPSTAFHSDTVEFINERRANRTNSVSSSSGNSGTPVMSRSWPSSTINTASPQRRLQPTISVTRCATPGNNSSGTPSIEQDFDVLSESHSTHLVRIKYGKCITTPSPSSKGSKKRNSGRTKLGPSLSLSPSATPCDNIRGSAEKLLGSKSLYFGLPLLEEHVFPLHSTISVSDSTAEQEANGRGEFCIPILLLFNYGLSANISFCPSPYRKSIQNERLKCEILQRELEARVSKDTESLQNHPAENEQIVAARRSDVEELYASATATDSTVNSSHTTSAGPSTQSVPTAISNPTPQRNVNANAQLSTATPNPPRVPTRKDANSHTQSSNSTLQKSSQEKANAQSSAAITKSPRVPTPKNANANPHAQSSTTDTNSILHKSSRGKADAQSSTVITNSPRVSTLKGPGARAQSSTADANSTLHKPSRRKANTQFSTAITDSPRVSTLKNANAHAQSSTTDANSTLHKPSRGKANAQSSTAITNFPRVSTPKNVNAHAQSFTADANSTLHKSSRGKANTPSSTAEPTNHGTRDPPIKSTTGAVKPKPKWK
ncbi:hypothetical protein BC936DRAFT_146430 [Jimgerdemannia flammicorona]|uniref:Protein kinase domain-containing protein n=1 Tax=Jimgerdemannia flammicorona TaxID=994334 RepID=A0A433D7N9_9FUNG|nr:hypothetical protein BC936DRAFT_146430 [Jimgerdemannia flammicorona]